jgi:hypothetical protein
MKRIEAFVVASLAVMMLVLAAPASAETQTYHATFVEIGGDTGTGGGGGGGAPPRRQGRRQGPALALQAQGRRDQSTPQAQAGQLCASA